MNGGVRTDHRVVPNRTASSLTMIGRGKKETTPISMSLTRLTNLEANSRKEKENDKISYDNLIDGWVKNSVREIVKNLREAPLLVHIYGDGNGIPMSLKTENAVSENWSAMRSEWEKGTSPPPQGVIFVEQLKDGEQDRRKDEFIDFALEGGVTRVWGVVVQGRGENSRPACYLLKTVRTGTPALGLYVTQFCLIRVSSFTETAETQFKKIWLVNGQ